MYLHQRDQMGTPSERCWRAAAAEGGRLPMAAARPASTWRLCLLDTLQHRRGRGGCKVPQPPHLSLADHRVMCGVR